MYGTSNAKACTYITKDSFQEFVPASPSNPNDSDRNQDSLQAFKAKQVVYSPRIGVMQLDPRHRAHRREDKVYELETMHR